jgi:CBS domain-containing protein
MSDRPIYHVIENQTILITESSISVSQAAVLMKQYGVGALLIVENEQLMGIFTERDALFRVLAEGKDPRATYLSDVMTPYPQTITPEKPLGHALHMMYEGGFRHVPVVKNGHVVGIVSARDALGCEIVEFESELIHRDYIAEILR